MVSFFFRESVVFYQERLLREHQEEKPPSSYDKYVTGVEKYPFGNQSNSFQPGLYSNLSPFVMQRDFDELL